MLYDLTGITETIDTAAIYRYFLAKLNNKIGIVSYFEHLVNNYASDSQNIIAILELCASFVENKSQRLISGRTAIHLYNFLKTMLPFWTKIMNNLEQLQDSDLII